MPKDAPIENCKLSPPLDDVTGGLVPVIYVKLDFVLKVNPVPMAGRI